MNETNVRCRSNNDDLKKFSWPEKFACRPMVGEWVYSLCGRRVAKIALISHRMGGHFDIQNPILEIDLQPI